ncbi:MAG: TIGR01212 family radical SAM protein, partial [Synergistetes bacterium]|nr:TIGR01212 family radical SAM protein [Synergistota bacterium]
MKRRYNSLNEYFKRRYGKRVQKITLDAGFFCPNRDGRLSRGGCIFCDEKGSGRGEYGILSLREQIERAYKFLGRRYKTNLFMLYFQAFSICEGLKVKHKKVCFISSAQELISSL